MSDKPSTMRKFESPEQMTQSAEDSYKTNAKTNKERDKDKGLDVDDPESIQKFQIKYTPIGNTLIIKVLEPIQQAVIAGMDLVDYSNSAKRFLVMVPGLLVTTLKKGDIVSAAGRSDNRDDGKIEIMDRIFGGIRFGEIRYNDIAGVFEDTEIIKKRFE